MKNIIFIAPPAAGKGTISKYLVDNYGYIHISTGDLLRKASKEESEVGKKIASLINNGTFVSDDLVLELIKQKLEKITDHPFILDGIPRNIKQAEYIENIFQKWNVNNYIVINMDISEDILKKRATGRRLCNKCRLSYNIYFDEYQPHEENKCNKCHNELYIRDDDSLEVFNSRYQIYLDNTLPVINFYKDKNLLKTVNANQNNSAIINEVLKIIKGEFND